MRGCARSVRNPPPGPGDASAVARGREWAYAGGMDATANPYEAPKADLDAGPPLEEREELPAAGRGARLLNFLIDSVISRMLLVKALAFLVVALDLGPSVRSWWTVIGVAAIVAYYVVLEAAFGWTLGKLITGTRVVAYNGARPSVLQILGRTAARFIPFEPFSLLGGSPPHGWHDSLSGTRVVRVRR